jgi:hypothetical protein
MMTTFTWETREQWGAADPHNRRYDVTPRGVAIHYPGPGRYTGSSHGTCQARMRAWQRMHMERGSNDLEYGLVLCEHLRLMEARIEQDRPNVRVGSNGTAAANTTHSSIQLMRGTDDPPPTAEELSALGEAVAWLRINGGWGPAVTGHRDHYATACPGDPLYAKLGVVRIVADRVEAAMRPDRDDPRPPVPSPTPPTPTPPPEGSPVLITETIGNTNHWLVLPGVKPILLNVSNADAESWTGSRLTITSEVAWKRLVDASQIAR